MLEVRLVFDKRALRARALVDSGADFCYLPYGLARALGVDAAQDGTGDEVVGGIGSVLRVRVVELELTIVDPTEPKPMFVPFLVPLEPDSREAPGRRVSPPLVVGRHPFFSNFKVEFDLGAAPSQERSVWSIQEAGSAA
jgi:hypothetical protein